jgi:hypothetical protein
MRTNVIEALSNSERGRRAERIPIGTASSIQNTTPPKTSDALTGAARRTMSFTSCRVANEVPSDCSGDDEEDDVGDDRDREEEDSGPEDASDQVAVHAGGTLPLSSESEPTEH